MVTHAFTNEKEEIAGLIVGEMTDDHIQIYTVIPLMRENQQSDRVEVSEEQLVEGMDKCDEISKKLNETIRIIGWYHSHPHITVFPSHIDLNTQRNFQSMDSNFFGLILSVFVEESDKKSQSIRFIAFRSSPKAEPQYPAVKIQPMTGPNVHRELFSVNSESWLAVSQCANKEILLSLKEKCSSSKDGLAKTWKFIQISENLDNPMILCAKYMSVGLNALRHRNST